MPYATSLYNLYETNNMACLQSHEFTITILSL